MRPKVVILTMLVAFGLLGAIVLIKGTLGKHDKSSDGQASNGQANADSSSASTNSAGMQAATTSGSAPVVSAQLRAALIGKELEQIQELVGEVDGSNNPVIVAALVNKISSADAEVRKAAIEALRELNDTNAIAGLEQAASNLSDPREKVAALDAVDYLKLPNITADIPADYNTNSDGELLGTETNQVTITPNMFRMNPKFSHVRRRVATNGHPAPASAPPTEPQ